MKIRILILLQYIVCTAFLFQAKRAFSQEEHTLLPITAYHGEVKGWGQVGVGHHESISKDCPKNHALFSLTRSSNPDRPATAVNVQGTCMRLPEDALLDVHVYSNTDCPADSVATGARTNHDITTSNCKDFKRCIELYRTRNVEMRCTSINTARYQLGEETPYVAWGWPRHISEHQMDYLPKSYLPAGVRYGIGRVNRYQWYFEGCIGRSFDTLLTRKEHRRCNGKFGRRLEYLGKNKDPKRGTPVIPVSSCLSVDNIYEENAACTTAYHRLANQNKK